MLVKPSTTQLTNSQLGFQGWNATAIVCMCLMHTRVREQNACVSDREGRHMSICNMSNMDTHLWM